VTLKPCGRDVPVKLPVAPVKIPVPHMMVSVSVPLFGWQSPRLPQTPGHEPSLKVSSMKIEPPARLIVRKSQLPPQPAPKSIVSVAWPSGMTSPLP